MTEPRRVRLFVTCLIDSLFPGSGEAVLDVLEGQEIQVDFPFAQTCCGQPAYNAGFREAACALALRFLDVFASGPEHPPVVCPSGSCAAMIRHGYPDLMRDRPGALARAQAIQRRASRAGFAWESAEQAWEALQEELRELREAATPEEQRDELGDALFALAGLARWLDVDAEEALRSTCGGFQTLFQRLENAVREKGGDLRQMTIAEKLALWQKAKQAPGP